MAVQPNLASITLRPVADEDRDFLLAVYAAGRAAELAMVPWDDAVKRAFVEHQYTAQDAHYRSHYKNSTHEIILFDGAPAGRLYLDRSDNLIAILDIGVLPEFRNRGIATQIVQDLQSESRQTNLPIRIFIEAFNPAQKLFTELGFEMVEDDGGLRRFMWEASTGKMS